MPPSPILEENQNCHPCLGISQKINGGEAGIRTLTMDFSNAVMGHDFWSQAFESLALTPLVLSPSVSVSPQE